MFGLNSIFASVCEDEDVTTGAATVSKPTSSGSPLSATAPHADIGPVPTEAHANLSATDSEQTGISLREALNIPVYRELATKLLSDPVCTNYTQIAHSLYRLIGPALNTDDEQLFVLFLCQDIITKDALYTFFGMDNPQQQASVSTTLSELPASSPTASGVESTATVVSTPASARPSTPIHESVHPFFQWVPSPADAKKPLPTRALVAPSIAILQLDEIIANTFDPNERLRLISEREALVNSLFPTNAEYKPNGWGVQASQAPEESSTASQPESEGSQACRIV